MLEVLKGNYTADTFEDFGEFVDFDDFNREFVPYGYARYQAHFGWCFAYKYRIGAQYLLLINQDRGRQTIYWDHLKPVNEQLRGPNDAWLSWVRLQLGR